MSENEGKLQKTTKRHTFPKGDKWNGNDKGRPRKPEIQVLRDALEKVEKEKDISFIEHFVRLAFSDKDIAKELAKKILPDKIQTETNDEQLAFILEKLADVLKK
ncbi:MAG: hypothetical protein PHH73_00185 [Candidatus Rickettsiella isopodorum]|nr:hypothetical protein [Candidatus Rickettsiella isopodorum]